MAKKCTVYNQYCYVHSFIHGGEAEELRSKIEKLIKDFRGDQRCHSDMDDLLDELEVLLEKVDARDSVAYLEGKEE